MLAGRGFYTTVSPFQASRLNHPTFLTVLETQRADGQQRFTAIMVSKTMKTPANSPSLKFSDAVCSGVLGPAGAGGVAATALVSVVDAAGSVDAVDAVDVPVLVLIVADLHPTISVTATNMIGMILRMVCMVFQTCMIGLFNRPFSRAAYNQTCEFQSSVFCFP
jgi:hypothetical protein